MLHEENTHLPYNSEGAMDSIFTFEERKVIMTLKCIYSRFMINHTDYSELAYLYLIFIQL